MYNGGMFQRNGAFVTEQSTSNSTTHKTSLLRQMLLIRHWKPAECLLKALQNILHSHQTASGDRTNGETKAYSNLYQHCRVETDGCEQLCCCVATDTLLWCMATLLLASSNTSPIRCSCVSWFYWTHVQISAKNDSLLVVYKFRIRDGRAENHSG